MEKKKGLFVVISGPSGVGKTMLAKKFSKKLSNNIIKLDMSEFSEGHSISKLIGSPAGYVGYDDNKNIFESIKDNPFSILILDEIDKAHPNIINLLYQILDEGKLNFVECKSGVAFKKEDVKSFDTLTKKTNYPIGSKCIICNTDKIYTLGDNIFVFPISVI